MNDERLEQLLKGYVPPAVAPALDRRVLADAAAILEPVGLRTTAEEWGRSLLDHLGFGVVPWLVDIVTTTDAEYSVELF